MSKSILVIFGVSLIFSLFAKAQVPGSPIDVQHYNFALQLNDVNNNIKGEATVAIKFLNRLRRDIFGF